MRGDWATPRHTEGFGDRTLAQPGFLFPSPGDQARGRWGLPQSVPWGRWAVSHAAPSRSAETWSHGEAITGTDPTQPGSGTGRPSRTGPERGAAEEDSHREAPGRPARPLSTRAAPGREGSALGGPPGSSPGPDFTALRCH